MEDELKVTLNQTFDDLLLMMIQHFVAAALNILL